MDRRIFTRYATRELLGVATAVAALLIPAGTWNRPLAWVATALATVWIIRLCWLNAWVRAAEANAGICSSSV